MNDIIHKLARYSNAHAISGFENEVRELLRQDLADCGSLRSDESRNFICTRYAADEYAPNIALLAHMDEIGFLVQSVTPDGFLMLVPIGGWWNHTLPSQRVLVQARGAKGKPYIPGQIGTKPPHLLPESQRSQVMPTDALFVDVGASCEAEVTALGIRTGCPVVPDVQLQELAIPHRVMGKAFDNRAGVYCMVEVMRRLAAEEASLPCTVAAVGTVQEEVGTRGARAMGHMADLHIIIEGPPADDSFGQPALCRQGVLGKGVQIRLFDPTHITPPELADWVQQVAEDNGIPHQVTVRRSGGTDAAACYPNWDGRPAIVLGVPCRYIHAHNGILDTRDLEACIQLCLALVKRAGEFFALNEGGGQH